MRLIVKTEEREITFGYAVIVWIFSLILISLFLQNCEFGASKDLFLGGKTIRVYSVELPRIDRQGNLWHSKIALILLCKNSHRGGGRRANYM